MLAGHQQVLAIDDEFNVETLIQPVESGLKKIDTDEFNLEAFGRALDVFLEDPTVLDRYLADWLVPLSNRLRSALLEGKPLSKYLAVFYYFCKVRGTQIIRSHFPHDVAVIRAVLEKTCVVLSDTEADWIDRTMLLTWCSLAVLVPFQIPGGLLNQVIELAKTRLFMNGKEGKSAALFLASVYDRPGQDIFELMGWARSVQSASDLGLLELSCAIVKLTGNPLCYQLKGRLEQMELSGMSLKLYLRFLCRLCLTMKHLIPTRTEGTSVSEVVQEALEKHLDALSDRDTQVRWTAAKGLGRICRLLDKGTVKDVLELLLADCQTPDHRHGVCLALGQIITNCPSIDLQHLTPFVLDCLKFELSKGTYAIGSNVRDSACYVCWAWCRYVAGLDESTILSLARGLLSVSLFDREISCRRAANAAFQELVGRTGKVPHGIHLMTQVNFFSISNIKESFDSLSLGAAQYPEYTESLIGHLLDVSCRSFDKQIRLMAAKALSQMSLNDQHISCLMQFARDPSDIFLNHAGLHALAHLANRDLPNHDLWEGLEQFRREAVPKKAGYQLLAESWLTVALSLSKNLLPEQVKCCLDIVTVALRSRFINLHQDYCVPLLERISAASSPGDAQLTAFYRTVVLPAADKDPDLNAQRGFSTAIATMPTWLFVDRMAPLTNLLCRLATTIDPINDVDKRAIIVGAFGKLHSREVDVPSILVQQVFTVLVAMLDDFSIDSRGDVGSFIREAAMVSFASLVPKLDKEQIVTGFGKVLQQLLDRMDRVRWTALTVLSSRTDWPLTVGSWSKSSSVSEIYDWTLQNGLLQDPAYRDSILSGWINAAGCPTPSVSDPAWQALKPYFGAVLPTILSDHLPWLNPSHRLCRSTLAVLAKWATQCEIDPAVASALSSAITANICEQQRAPIQILVDAFALLKAIPVQEARVYVRQASNSHPLPRIRQICSSTLDNV